MNIEQQLDICIRLTAAFILSAIVGLNREREDHPAGLRTHILVGLGASLFTGLSIMAFPGGDQARVASYVVVGIGFLGAGMIIEGREPSRVRGLTTAAGIWSVAAIGMACGSASYLLAAIATILIWFVLEVIRRMEKKFISTDNGRPTEQP